MKSKAKTSKEMREAYDKAVKGLKESGKQIDQYALYCRAFKSSYNKRKREQLSKLDVARIDGEWWKQFHRDFDWALSRYLLNHKDALPSKISVLDMAQYSNRMQSKGGEDE